MIPRVAASERGIVQTISMLKPVCVVLMGLRDLSSLKYGSTGDIERNLVEQLWKGWPKKVIAL